MCRNILIPIDGSETGPAGSRKSPGLRAAWAPGRHLSEASIAATLQPRMQTTPARAWRGLPVSFDTAPFLAESSLNNSFAEAVMNRDFHVCLRTAAPTPITTRNGERSHLIYLRA